MKFFVIIYIYFLLRDVYGKRSREGKEVNSIKKRIISKSVNVKKCKKSILDNYVDTITIRKISRELKQICQRA